MEPPAHNHTSYNCRAAAPPQTEQLKLCRVLEVKRSPSCPALQTRPGGPVLQPAPHPRQPAGAVQAGALEDVPGSPQLLAASPPCGLVTEGPHSAHRPLCRGLAGAQWARERWQRPGEGRIHGSHRTHSSLSHSGGSAPCGEQLTSRAPGTEGNVGLYLYLYLIEQLYPC